MSSRYRRRRRSNSGKFANLPEFMLKCEAYQNLSIYGRGALVEILRLYNGTNNGQLALGARGLGERLGCSKSRAALALNELEEKGFVGVEKVGTFGRHDRLTTEYFVTLYRNDVTGEPPTKLFLEWKPPEGGESKKRNSTVHKKQVTVHPDGPSLQRHLSRSTGVDRHGPKMASHGPLGWTHIDLHHQDSPDGQSGESKETSPSGSRSAPIGGAVASEPPGQASMLQASPRWEPRDPATIGGELAALFRERATSWPSSSAIEPPNGRRMLALQRWGASPEEARDLVNRLVEVAGSRLPNLDRLFDHMERRRRWDGKRKVKWLHQQAEKMRNDLVYWPAQKKSRPDVGTEMILAALQGSPRSKEELIKITGKTSAAIASATQMMVNAGEIIRVRPGVFALPTPGTTNHVSGFDAVLAALTAARREMSTGELVTATGKPRSAIDAALHRLRESGAIVTICRGLFALAPRPADVADS